MSLDSKNFKNEILNLYSKKNYKEIINKKHIFDNFNNYNDNKILKIYFVSCLKTSNFEYITDYENYILTNSKDREIIFILIFAYIKHFAQILTAFLLLLVSFTAFLILFVALSA